MKAVDRTRSRDYLTKAENSLRIAKIALEQGAYDKAVMSSQGKEANGVKLTEKDVRLDFGSPETLMEALRISGEHLTKQKFATI